MTLIDPRLQWLYEDTAPSLRPAIEVDVHFAYDGDPGVLTRLGMRVLATSGGVVSARMALSFLPRIRELGLAAIELSQRASPTLDVSRHDVKGDRLRPTLGADAGAGVIVGLVDTGIDYAHPSFRGADGKTRILYLWING